MSEPEFSKWPCPRCRRRVHKGAWVSVVGATGPRTVCSLCAPIVERERAALNGCYTHTCSVCGAKLTSAEKAGGGDCERCERKNSKCGK